MKPFGLSQTALIIARDAGFSHNDRSWFPVAMLQVSRYQHFEIIMRDFGFHMVQAATYCAAPDTI